MQPVDKTQGAAAVDLAADAGIPLITLNTITDSTNNVAHVGCDDVESGELQMQRIIDVCGSDGGKIPAGGDCEGYLLQCGRDYHG